jgi:hypothetical protein
VRAESAQGFQSVPRDVRLNNKMPIPSWNNMSAGERAAISRRWRDEGSRYAREWNSFVERLGRVGPEQAGEVPQDPRSDLAQTVLEAVREANESGELARLREQFPPAYDPFLDLLGENGQTIGPLVWLESGKIVARVRGLREPAKAYLIEDLHIETLPGILSFGRSPDRRYFAVARDSGIAIHDGWDGPQTTNLDWPTIGTREGLAEFSRLIPFPDGRRVLLGNRDAIVVLGPHERTILFPRDEDGMEDCWLNNPHGAVSPDGSLIAVGDRLTGAHLIFDDRYELVGKVAGLVDTAPCHASFSNDGRFLALSSFILVEGATVVVPTRHVSGLVFDESDRKRFWLSKATWPLMRQGLKDFNPDLTVLGSFACAHVSAWRPGEFILGDAEGRLWGFDRDGEVRWHHFIGSSCTGIDISADGRRLILGTYAGFLVTLDLDTGKPDAYRIGTSTHQEQRRWLFWRKENKPLIW